MNNSQEQECDNHPSNEIDSDGIEFHPTISTIGLTDARAGDEQGGKREPECAVGRKRCTKQINGQRDAGIQRRAVMSRGYASAPMSA